MVTTKEKRAFTIRKVGAGLRPDMFFKSQGFQGISILRDFYEDTAEDAILMQWKVRQESFATQ